jgi:hypothetical protein
MTDFVVNDSSVWGRPVGVTVAHDGALLVSEDGNGTIWRISYRGESLGDFAGPRFIANRFNVPQGRAYP